MSTPHDLDIVGRDKSSSWFPIFRGGLGKPQGSRSASLRDNTRSTVYIEEATDDRVTEGTQGRGRTGTELSRRRKLGGGPSRISVDHSREEPDSLRVRESHLR